MLDSNPQLRFFKRIYNHFMKDSFYRNSIYLMLATFLTAGLGFVFWFINTRLFTVAQVGLGAAMISTISLLTSLGGFGFGLGTIRYLPSTHNKTDLINSVLTTSCVATAILAAIFVVGIPFWSPVLRFITSNPLLALMYIGAIALMAVYSLIDSVFVAYRSAQYALLDSAVYSTMKLILPFALIGMGALAIFGSVVIAAGVSLAVLFSVLALRFHHKLRFVIHFPAIRRIAPFSLSSYASSFAGNVHEMVLPLIIANLVSTEVAAYYYTSLTIAGALLFVPLAVTQRLFAELSSDPVDFEKHVWKAVRIIGLLLIPAVFIIVFFGDYILLFFGKQYSTEGFRFLQLLALSSPLLSVHLILGVILRARDYIIEYVVMSGISGASILLFSILFLHLGLVGIGVAWIIGYVLTIVAYFLFMRKKISLAARASAVHR